MLLKLKTILGGLFECQYTDVKTRDEWFEKMVRKTGESLYDKRFIIDGGRLVIEDLGSFIFENEKEAKDTWKAYLSRCHVDFTGV
jgi:hypothetical protein